MEINQIRNFCIIAHIDHGKSTLADRFIELTNTIEKREMKDQILDTMSLEQERGITIKLQPVRMKFKFNKVNYYLNLIDTPGHVDFNYEVSRTLKAVEGAILLVDAVKGIQAQTLSNLYLAIEQDLKIIPVINKIDLPNARVSDVEKEIKELLGPKEEIHKISAKNGHGVLELLKEVILKIPKPSKINDNTKALVFDSFYDDYKGVIAFVRVFNGSFKKNDQIFLNATNTLAEIKELGFFHPELIPSKTLNCGDIGFIVTGLKDITKVKVGDTLYIKDSKPKNLLSGYKNPSPVVFASIFPQQGDDYDEIKEALFKLQLSDSSIEVKNEHSSILGRGFRIGLLGRLHLEIVKERLKRESNVDVIVTSPSVAYKIKLKSNEILTIKSATNMPKPDDIIFIEEPWAKVEIVTPIKFKGAVFTLLTNLRASFKKESLLGKDRITLEVNLPLSELLTNLHDNLKSVSSGYASFSYEFDYYRSADLVKLEVLVNHEKIEAFSKIILKTNAFKEGKKIVERLKNLIPRESFVIPLQATINGKIIARETIKAYRKDVTAKLYGGDVTRKMKLLKKQKKGKKKMESLGKVNIPSDVFLKAAISD